MSQLILTRRSQFHRSIHTSSPFPLSMRVGKFFLIFALTLSIGVLSFFYLVKFTEIHTKGYQLRKLELQREKLLTSREVKSVQIAKEKSLAAVRETAVAFNMIPERNAFFLRGDDAIAQIPSVANRP